MVRNLDGDTLISASNPTLLEVKLVIKLFHVPAKPGFIIMLFELLAIELPVLFPLTLRKAVVPAEIDADPLLSSP